MIRFEYTGFCEILCDLKLISASKSRYPRNPQPRDGKRAVDRRADGLTAEYARKAREVDHTYGGVPRLPPAPPGAALPPRVVGRVERRLQSYGEVILIPGGTFVALISHQDLINLITMTLAKSKSSIEFVLHCNSCKKNAGFLFVTDIKLCVVKNNILLLNDTPTQPS